MSREAMQMALDALEGVAQWVEKRPDTHPWDAWQRIDPAITALKQALAEPEQPVACNNTFSCRCPKHFAAPPQREHITDGSPCWCNPDVFEEDGGNVIVHNYDDHWQQYAKPGETAQQCIERHRGEQDALMKLYATPRKPLTNEELEPLCDAVDSYDITNYDLVKFARAIERAHGITGETK